MNQPANRLTIHPSTPIRPLYPFTYPTIPIYPSIHPSSDSLGYVSLGQKHVGRRWADSELPHLHLAPVLVLPGEHTLLLHQHLPKGPHFLPDLLL